MRSVVRCVKTVVVSVALACDTPNTCVIIDNAYATTSGDVVYAAFWEATAFTAPITPGNSSEPHASVFASANAAYAVLAPGWDPQSTATPTLLVVLKSRAEYALDFDNTLHIVIDDATFAGNCATGSPLSQSDADFITQRVFQSTFAGLHYDAATCTTSPRP